MSATEVQAAYLVKVEHLAAKNPHYEEVLQYLRRPSLTSTKPGSGTRVIIADVFDTFADQRPLAISELTDTQDYNHLFTILSTPSPNIKLRLVAVWCTSGIGDAERHKHLWQAKKPITAFDAKKYHHLPIVTQLPVNANNRLENPIPNYKVATLDPSILGILGGLLDIHPGVFSEQLGGHGEFSTFLRPSTFVEATSSGRKAWQILPTDWLKIGVNEKNQMSSKYSPLSNSAIMFVVEDDYLGVDLSYDAVPARQPLFSTSIAYPNTIYDSFRAWISTLHRAEGVVSAIVADPTTLAHSYAYFLSNMFTCHLDLCSRLWDVKYGRLSRMLYKVASEQDQQLAAIIEQNHRVSLRYIRFSIDSMRERGAPSTSSAKLLPLPIAEFQNLQIYVQDFIYKCNRFIDHQMVRTGISENMESRAEAQELKVLSYLGFFFVPLSLATSIFGMNIQEFGTGVPLCTFIVAAIITFAISCLILVLSRFSWKTISEDLKRRFS